MFGREFQGAIFDLDGTLLDSMSVWEQIDIDFFHSRGMELPYDYQDMVTPMSPVEAAKYTIERFGFPDTPEQLMQEWHEMAFHYYRDVLTLKEGAADFVKKLHREGIPMAIASSSFREMIEAALKRNGILLYFKTIVTTMEVARGKRFPDIYEKAAGEIGVLPGECLVFEDIPEAIGGAKKGGFFTVGVHEQGSSEEQMRSLSDAYIYSFTELL